MNEEMLFQNEAENEILEVIDNQNEYTRSDLQGRVSAIVMKILEKGKELGTAKKAWRLEEIVNGKEEWICSVSTQEEVNEMFQFFSTKYPEKIYIRKEVEVNI